MEKFKADFLSKLLYIVTLLGLAAVSFMLVTLPWCIEIIFKDSAFYSMVDHKKILVLLYVTGFPAWTVVWMTKGLAKNIIKRDPFSRSSCTYLKWISFCAVFIFLCYLYTCFFMKATFGIIVITIGAFIVALIAAILYRLVDLAIDIKEENELTI